LIVNETIEARLLKNYITPQFIQELIGLFDTENDMERDYLKSIVHKLYAKVVP